MARSTHHPDYQVLLEVLRRRREESGLTQGEVALALGNTQTFVSKVERGERRIDVIELVEWCEALGFSPGDTFGELLSRRAARHRKELKLKKATRHR